MCCLAECPPYQCKFWSIEFSSTIRLVKCCCGRVSDVWKQLEKQIFGMCNRGFFFLTNHRNLHCGRDEQLNTLDPLDILTCQNKMDLFDHRLKSPKDVEFTMI